MARNGELVQQSILFSIELIDFYKWLCQTKKEYILSKQVLKSGTSIGANIHEAVYGISTADFVSKIHISLKEASETEYWFQILEATGHLPDEYAHLKSQCKSLVRMLIAILNTAKSNTDRKN